MTYCQHDRCRCSSAADLARIGMALKRPDILYMATQAALDDTIQVRCRMYPGQLTADGLVPLENFA